MTTLCPFSSDDMICLASFDSPEKSTGTAAGFANSASRAVFKLFENPAADMAFSGAIATMSADAPDELLHFLAWLQRLYLYVNALPHVVHIWRRTLACRSTWVVYRSR